MTPNAQTNSPASVDVDPPAAAPDPPRRLRWRRRWTGLLVLAAGALAALTFAAAANYVHVEVRLIGWQGELRLSWAILGAAAIGFLLGLVLSRLLR
ncbi:MAG: hypothetical protein QOF73_1561 [Thermomicrobiales bacterium]|jgi:uncharacterized integral membrane protein|nr:hypothetical protein [Thermomicrobiales bacterium]